MLVELVQTTTKDGIKLHGTLRKPQGDGDLPIDAVLCVHGTGGSFYSSTVFDAFSDEFVKGGVAVLCINTRGHDLVSTAATLNGGVVQGAAYEKVDDCRHDLNAWCKLLGKRGYQRLGLMGHSLGAVKVLYATANTTLAAERIIAVSPPRLSYQAFLGSPAASRFQASLDRAERKVTQGDGDALIDVDFPLPMLITAAGYLDKYGPEERYNFIRYLDQIPTKTLFTFGSIEVTDNDAFRNLPELIREHEGPFAVEVVKGGNHFYTNVRTALVETTMAWLRNGIGSRE